jgi:NitT/TauT family transport system permease protein
MLFIGVIGMGSSALVKKIGDLAMPWYHMQRKRQ